MKKFIHKVVRPIIHVLLVLVIFLGVCRLRVVLVQAKELHFGNLPHPIITLTKKKGVDYHKLAKAISCAETSCGKDGTAVHRNNCCGIMVWDRQGNRHPRYFTRYEDSLKEAAKIWERAYQRFPDLHLATKWTGEPEHAAQWLATVQSVYQSL